MGRRRKNTVADRVLEAFSVGRAFRRMATDVDEEVGIGDLKRTMRLLMSLKRAGKLDSELVSEMVGERRVRRRWWWRLR